MKNARHIISNLLQNKEYNHLFKRVRVRQSLENLKILLPTDMQKNLLAIAYKNHKILFSFTHPSYCKEFNNYKSKDIISCLNAHKEIFSEIDMPVEIIGYVPKTILQNLNKDEIDSSLPHFKEHSKGTFKNLASDKEIYEAFEKIRKAILKLQVDEKNE